MDRFKINYKSIDSKLQGKNIFTNILAYFEKVTGVPRSKICVGICFVVILYVLFGPYAIAIVNLIGFIYPAYASLNEIESRNKTEDIKWMTYWTIYSYLILLESFLEKVLLSIPFYPIFKCAFLIFCMISNPWNGSLIFYKHILRPLIVQNKATIDSAVTTITNEANDFLTKVN